MTYGNSIVIGSIRCERYSDANDTTQHICNGPPSIFRILVLNVCNDRGDECNKPCKLRSISGLRVNVNVACLQCQLILSLMQKDPQLYCSCSFCCALVNSSCRCWMASSVTGNTTILGHAWRYIKAGPHQAGSKGLCCVQSLVFRIGPTGKSTLRISPVASTE